MAATLPVFTQKTSFGVSTGPTYTGQSTVTGTSMAEPRLYSANCLHGANTTIDSSGFTYTNLLAFGFTMVLDPVQTGSPTTTQLANATVTVHFTDALSGGATDYTFAVPVGAQTSYVVIPALIAHNAVSIIVYGDTYCDCDIYGIVMLSA